MRIFCLQSQFPVSSRLMKYPHEMKPPNKAVLENGALDEKSLKICLTRLQSLIIYYLNINPNTLKSSNGSYRKGFRAK